MKKIYCGIIIIFALLTVACTGGQREDTKVEPAVIENGDSITLVTENTTREEALVRSLAKMSEKMQLETQEKRKLEHRLETMRIWIIVISAIALLLLSVLCAMLIRIRHREKLSQIVRQYAEKEAKMQHNLEEAEQHCIIGYLEPESLKEQGFEAFRGRFATHYPGALERLLSAADNLGSREQLLCMLLILGTDAQRLPDLLAIAPDSVKKSRQRIRRKLNLRSDQDLTESLRAITQIQIEENQWEK